MASMHLQKPSRRLALVFVAWKLVLFFVSALAPGPGYDTSALVAWNPRNLRHTEYQSWSWGARFSLNFFRWDALYFVQSAHRGYVYEQEWAFSWAYSLLVKNVVKCMLDRNRVSVDYRNVDRFRCQWNCTPTSAILCSGRHPSLERLSPCRCLALVPVVEHTARPRAKWTSPVCRFSASYRVSRWYIPWRTLCRISLRCTQLPRNVTICAGLGCYSPYKQAYNSRRCFDTWSRRSVCAGNLDEEQRSAQWLAFCL